MTIIRDNVKGGALTETTFLVLLAVYKPIHGYGIMQFIENETSGRVTLGAGTLYGALNTLLKKGWIEPVGDNHNETKKDYLITERGMRVVADEFKRISDISILAKKILGRADL